MNEKLSARWNRFGSRPARSLLIFTAVSTLIWIVQTACCQRILPLDSIEAIVWGGQWQWGQMKSPPLSGWIAYIFAWGSGFSDWGQYLAAQLCVVSGVYFTYKLARDFFDECEAATAALLLYFLYYYMPPAMKFCSHDTQIALFPAIGFFFWRALRDNFWRDWCLTAVFSALAVLGKYAAFQLLFGCFVFMAATKIGRSRMRSVKPYCAALFFLALLIPHFLWLLEHDFLPLRHLDDRIVQSWHWYDPLAAAGTMAMPFALTGALLLLSFIPWKNLTRRPEMPKTALAFALALTLVPGGIYLALSLTGHSIILMWYSYLASFTGIVVVALMPWRCTPEIFRRLLAAVWLYFAILLVAVTLDVLAKPRLRIHTEPAQIADVCHRFYQEQTGKTIPLIYGDRWLAGVVENYLDYRPPAFVAGDLCDWTLYEEKLRKEGALLIVGTPQEAEWLLKKLAFSPAPEWKKFQFTYHAQFGRSRNDEFLLAVLPPATRQGSAK